MDEEAFKRDYLGNVRKRDMEQKYQISHNMFYYWLGKLGLAPRTKLGHAGITVTVVLGDGGLRMPFAIARALDLQPKTKIRWLVLDAEKRVVQLQLVQEATV